MNIFRVLARFHLFFNIDWRFYRSEPAKIPLAKELRALSITPEAALAPQPQRRTEPEVLQMQTEPTEPQRQAESETETERDTPSEPKQSSRMPESIKITEPDKFDGKDTSIATVTAWAFSVKEYMELAEVPEAK